jgi:hypothetical protein
VPLTSIVRIEGIQILCVLNHESLTAPHENTEIEHTASSRPLAVPIFGACPGRAVGGGRPISPSPYPLQLFHNAVSEKAGIGLLGYHLDHPSLAVRAKLCVVPWFDSVR